MSQIAQIQCTHCETPCHVCDIPSNDFAYPSAGLRPLYCEFARRTRVLQPLLVLILRRQKFCFGALRKLMKSCIFSGNASLFSLIPPHHVVKVPRCINHSACLLAFANHAERMAERHAVSGAECCRAGASDGVHW